jgi:hypothetical protein
LLHSRDDLSTTSSARFDKMARGTKVRTNRSILIEEYADAKGLRRFAHAPPQLQHIGSTSSRFNLDINTRSTWAFWFEENDPEVLDREHESLVRGGKVPMDFATKAGVLILSMYEQT